MESTGEKKRKIIRMVPGKGVGGLEESTKI